MESEAVKEIQNLKQKSLWIQREKCYSFEAQQDILIDILDIPPEERNFLSLRKGLENLKNEHFIEKEKLSIQREKCNSFEAQQDILMDILNIPPKERNFLTLRKGLENLKNEYIIEKERADNLACTMPLTDPKNSFKCYHFENGCKEEFLTKKFHEKSCTFQKVLCPSLNCKQLLIANDMNVHLDQDHEILEVNDEWNFEGTKDELVKVICCLTSTKYDQQFFPLMYIKDDHLYFKVAMLGHQENVMYFKAHFTFFRDNGQQISKEDDVYPITDKGKEYQFSIEFLKKLTEYYDLKSMELKQQEKIQLTLKITNAKLDEIAKDKAAAAVESGLDSDG